MDYQGPMPDVSGDVLRYLAQFHNRYPNKPNPELDPNNMKTAATNAFHNTGITVPDSLAISQAQFETGFGTDSRGGNAHNNPFNIGVYDDRTVYNPSTQLQGVQKYYDTMTHDYLRRKTLAQLLQNFVNKDGHRYASNPHYEKQIQDQVQVVEKRMK